MTAREIAQETGEKIGTVYSVAFKNKIELKRSQNFSTKLPKGRYDREQCKGRPQSCFTCTNPECICRDKCTPTESAFLFLGVGDTENNQSSTKMKAFESEVNGND
jgi:hypothetical protein